MSFKTRHNVIFFTYACFANVSVMVSNAVLLHIDTINLNLFKSSHYINFINTHRKYRCLCINDMNP